jgi:3-hydroxybutyryl-CoA dehydrogenase
LTITSICVAGGGAMGLGILRGFAGSGIALSLLTRDPAAPKPGLPGEVALISGFEGPPPDLLIESIPEDLALKQAFLARAEAAWGGRCLIASNTSVLPLQAMADGMAHPERFCGLHYMYPADTWEFVELIAVGQTDPAMLDAMEGALRAAGRRAIRLAKPIVGALINRLQHAMAHEAYSMIADGAVDAATVDLVMRRLLAPRMCITGLIEQKDLSGLGTHAASQSQLVPHLSPRTEAVGFVRDLPARGETGAGSGLGFYDWRETDPAAFRAFAARQVQRILAVVAEAEAERPGVAPRPRRHPAGTGEVS